MTDHEWDEDQLRWLYCRQCEPGEMKCKSEGIACDGEKTRFPWFLLLAFGVYVVACALFVVLLN